jgi:hypothetical protein
MAGQALWDNKKASRRKPFIIYIISFLTSRGSQLLYPCYCIESCTPSIPERMFLRLNSDTSSLPKR